MRARAWVVLAVALGLAVPSAGQLAIKGETDPYRAATEFRWYDVNANLVASLNTTTRTFTLPAATSFSALGSVTLGSTAIGDVSAAESAKLDGLATGAYLPVTELVSFTEAGAAGVYTGTVTVPAGALIIDVKVWSTVLWGAGTSALMDVGDVTDPDGWYIQIDMKATDLLVGEEINFIQTGGKEGAYLSLTTGARVAAYSASARVLSGVITTVGTTSTAGRSFMAVVYVLPTATAATKVAS